MRDYEQTFYLSTCNIGPLVFFFLLSAVITSTSKSPYPPSPFQIPPKHLRLTQQVRCAPPPQAHRLDRSSLQAHRSLPFPLFPPYRVTLFTQDTRPVRIRSRFKKERLNATHIHQSQHHHKFSGLIRKRSTGPCL